MMNCLFLFFLISLALIVRGDPAFYSVIGTGRGVITAEETPAGSFKVVERPYTRNTTDDDVDNFQLWYLYVAGANPGDSYGYLIISEIVTLDGNIVWDCTGAQYTAGTQIIAYALKNGLEETNNQRWLQSGNEWEIVGSPTMVANVTQAGNVVLAKKVTGSPYQQFIFYDAYSDIGVEVDNQYYTTVYLNYSTPVGSWQYVLSPNNTYSRALFSGSVIYITDANGAPISPSPYTITGSTNNAFVRVPAPAPLPSGARQWSGFFVVNSTRQVNTTFTLTFDAPNSAISGSGSDTFGGAFSISGTIYADGGIFSFTKTYTSSSSVDEFDGTLNGASTIMTGIWSRTDGTPNYSGLSFQFTLISQ